MWFIVNKNRYQLQGGASSNSNITSRPSLHYVITRQSVVSCLFFGGTQSVLSLVVRKTVERGTTEQYGLGFLTSNFKF